jgi:hypothetical protein
MGKFFAVGMVVFLIGLILLVIWGSNPTHHSGLLMPGILLGGGGGFIMLLIGRGSKGSG